MAFVYEKLTEADKAFFESFELKHPLDRFSLAYTPRNWVCDREREMFFFPIGGRGLLDDPDNPPSWFYFIWKKKKIKVQTYRKATGDWNIGINMTWKIDRIVAPDSLRGHGAELQALIKQAFEARTYGMEKKVNSIEFIEIANPEFTKGAVENG